VREAEDCLLALLEAWKEQRSYPLARAVHALSGRFLRRHPPLDDLMAWHKLAAARDPLSVTALLAAPVRPDLRALRRILAALAEFPPDPRLAMYGLRWLDQRRLMREPRDEAASRARELWRLHGPIASGGAEPLHTLGPSEEQALLAQVAASDGEAPWLVYADWLMEQGDPFGERLSGWLRGQKGPSPGPSGERWLKHHLGLVELSFAAPWKVPDALLIRGHLEGRPSLTWDREAQLGLIEPGREDLLWASSLPGLTRLALSFPGGDAAERLAEAEQIFRRTELRELRLVQPCWQAGRHGLAGSWPHLERLDMPLVEGGVRLDAELLGALGTRPLELVLRGDAYAWAEVLQELVLAAARAAPGLRRVSLLDRDAQRLLSLDRDSRGGLRRMRPVWYRRTLSDLTRLPAGSLLEVVTNLPEPERASERARLARLGIELLFEDASG
jgi:uncharacterized protein (TIGR02996 family)